MSLSLKERNDIHKSSWYLGSFLTFQSTAMLPSFDSTISLASLAVKASFNLFLKRTLRGTHSLNL
jgi:hypothetical protein